MQADAHHPAEPRSSACTISACPPHPSSLSSPPSPAEAPLDDLWATNSRAFSLIELLIVLGILGTIATIAVPLYLDTLDRARVARAIGDVVALSHEVSLFHFDNGRYPDDLGEIGRSSLLDPYGLPYRYTNIAGPRAGGGNGGSGGKKGKKKDGGGASAGGRKDRFLVPVNSDFDLYSMGKDMLSTLAFTAKQSHDDIVRANNGMFIGLAEDF